jgi:hypothetical protein
VVPDQIFSNGDFSDGLSNWTPITHAGNDTVAVVQSSHFDGKSAVQLTIDRWNFRVGGPTIQQGAVNICPYEYYEFTFDYYIVTADPHCYIAFFDFQYNVPPGLGVYLPGELPAVQLSQTGKGSYSTTIFGVANHLFEIDIGIACNQTSGPNRSAAVQLTNIATKKSGSLETPGCPRNDSNLPNGGFETGDLTDWKIYYQTPKNSTYEVVSPGHDSDHMLRVNWPSGAYGYHAFILRHHLGHVCLGYNYTFQFGYLFTNFTAPVNYTHNSPPLLVNIASNACDGKDPNPVNDRNFAIHPNWHHAEWQCVGVSEGPDLYVYVSFESSEDAEDIPGFDLYFDNLQFLFQTPVGAVGEQ